MNLTRKGEYALRSLIKLGIAQDLGHSHLSVSELARSEQLPLKFLEQVLFALRGGGLIDTKRGKYGGYFLAKPMAEVKIGDVVRLIDGKLAPISCASLTAYDKCSCPDEDHCGLRMLMIDVRNAISNILDRYTLANVVDVTLRKIRRDKSSHFFLNSNFKEGPNTSPDNNPADPAHGFLAGLLDKSS